MSIIRVDAIQSASGVQKYVASAWMNANMTGTPSIRASGNVSSITDNGVGDWTINFTTSFANTNYAVVASAAFDDAVTAGATHRGVAPRSPTISSIRLILTDGNVGADPLRLSMVAFQ